MSGSPGYYVAIMKVDKLRRQQMEAETWIFFWVSGDVLLEKVDFLLLMPWRFDIY